MRLKERLLLEILGKSDVTRKELVEKLGVAKSTLSYVLTELKEEGKVSIKTRIRGRGRPEELITISPNAWKAIGVKMGREAVIGVLMDASLKEIRSVELDVTSDMRNEEGYRKLLRRVLEILGSAEVSAVGLSVSGIVESGIVLESPMLNLRNADFRNELSSFKAFKVMG